MTRFKSVLMSVRANARWLALVALPLVLAACNGGSGGNGY
jgi:hypothetical protein